MAVIITRSKRGPDVIGVRRHTYADIALDTSYPVGGYALTAAQFGGRKLESIEAIGGNPASGRLRVWWDSVSRKLMALYPSGGGAVSPAALSDPAITAGAVAVTSTAANGAADLTPGQGKEVANATNLSTITVAVRVITL